MKITLKNTNNSRECDLNLPFDEAELMTAYDKIGVPKEDILNTLKEIEYVHIVDIYDYATTIGSYLEYMISKYDYMLLNAIMYAYYDLDEWRREIADNIFYAVRSGNISLTTLCSILSEVEADNFEYSELCKCPYGDSVYADFGYTYGEENVSLEFEGYVDWERYGEEILDDGNYILLDDGYISDPDDYMDYNIWCEHELKDGSYVAAILGDSFKINTEPHKTNTHKMSLNNDAFNDFLSA